MQRERVKDYHILYFRKVSCKMTGSVGENPFNSLNPLKEVLCGKVVA
jgi:hypothetical protein